MVPPGLLMRRITALIRSSFSAFLSSSRTRARRGTRGGGEVRENDTASSARTPDNSRRRILSRPSPSTVSSSSGLIRGWRSMETSDWHAEARTATARRRAQRMGLAALAPVVLGGDALGDVGELLEHPLGRAQG